MTKVTNTQLQRLADPDDAGIVARGPFTHEVLVPVARQACLGPVCRVEWAFKAAAKLFTDGGAEYLDGIQRRLVDLAKVDEPAMACSDVRDLVEVDSAQR